MNPPSTGLRRARMFLQIGVLLLLSGCATADFTPYSGTQQNWPVAAGAFVETKYDVPVYRGTPDRPYRVLGYLSADTAPVRRHAVTAFMARRAKELGGDALILTSKGAEYQGSIQTSSANAWVSGNIVTASGMRTTIPLYRGKGEGVVIKFL